VITTVTRVRVLLEKYLKQKMNLKLSTLMLLPFAQAYVTNLKLKFKKHKGDGFVIYSLQIISQALFKMS
jgi:hypothetical protein